MAVDQLYLMTPIEIARGYLVGHEGTLAPPRPDAPRDPRPALETVVRESLERPPCGVAFSGGRDSSAVLAVATHVARRDGLPDPVPITRVFPGVAESEESEWQELVIRHLGLTEWVRIQMTDELDIVGPLAVRLLERHGVLWPPTIHGDIPFMEPVHGGSLLDGEGGDEVLGAEAHRIAGLTKLIRHPRPLHWPRIRSALGAVAPRALRYRYARRRASALSLTWLQPAVRAAFLDDVARAEAAQPLAFATSVRMVPRRRTQALLAHNRRLLARPYDVAIASPLLHPDVVHALAHSGGILGTGDRTATLTGLIADLLPTALLSRTTKATFGGAFMGTPTRAFADLWAGDGLDPELVDSSVLRRLWRSGEQAALTAALLQAAWLASLTRRSHREA